MKQSKKMTNNTIRVAILDMYDGAANEGLRCLKKIIENHTAGFEYEIFNVRQLMQFPDLSFDIYISTGGPGDPNDTGNWGTNYFQLMDDIMAFNKRNNYKKKNAFFICHSFQLMCNHLNLGDVTLRNRPSFGIFPVHKTLAAFEDNLLDDLTDPFYAVDSRDWQVVNPNHKQMEKIGAEILALEKIRDHVEFERALMAIKFTPEFYGTQFHPEADVEGMLTYFKREDKQTQIIEQHGIGKYEQMIISLNDPEKIKHTHTTVLPNFLEISISSLQEI